MWFGSAVAVSPKRLNPENLNSIVIHCHALLASLFFVFFTAEATLKIPADMLQAYITHSKDIVWKPSPVVALATSVDDSQVAAARDDGSLEVWLVSPGAVGWHCLLTIHGDPISRVSSLVWCRVSSNDPPCGRLFSSSIDGTVSEWDLLNLKQKIVLDTIGVSIWQMALAPLTSPVNMDQKLENIANGHSKNKVIDADDHDTSESEGDSDTEELQDQSSFENLHVALGCDDGCVRLYSILDSDELVYYKSFPRVSGRVLSVTWSTDAKMIYSGSSDGYIRCWDAKTAHEIYRITVGLGGLGSKAEVCVWSLIALRSGTIVSGDSTGSVQFWDGQHGTQLQAHTFHKGDVNALAAAPSHNRVFSAGSDGKVIQYKLSSSKDVVSDDLTSVVMKKWVYIGHVQAHTHDIRALTVAVPISQEDAVADENVKRFRRKKKPIDFTYHKWAHLGIPMLISAGDDTKLFAYSVNEFAKFSPHDICPAPQRVPIQLVLNTGFNQMSLLLVQTPDTINILSVSLKNGVAPDVSTGHVKSHATTVLAAKVSCKAHRKIVCSAISPSGSFFSYSDHVKPNMYELKWDVKSLKKDGKIKWILDRKQLPKELPFAHSMVFSFDSSRLMIAGHDKRIYVVDVKTSQLLHTFTPCREEPDKELPPSEPPITKMFTSSDGQWLAAVNCFGDIYIFNLEIQRQHWFISRLNGASVTAGGFPPQNSNVLIVTTSSNQVYAFDVEAKQLGEWSMRHTFVLPRRFQEFPGEVIGLSFPAAVNSTVVIYSARAMCLIDFGMPLDRDDDCELTNGEMTNGELTNGELTNGLDSALKRKIQSVNGSRLKRKLKEASLETKLIGRKNFEFYAFRNPVLFIGHLSKNCVLIIDKPWSDVARTFEAPPVHRHIYGT